MGGATGTGPLCPTPYSEVNSALAGLDAGIRAVLGRQVVGVYLSGSLALGDFDPSVSDIDLVVITDGEVGDDLFRALSEMHAAFAGGSSPCAAKVEAVYVPRDALHRQQPGPTRYPQLEKGGELAREPLESAWSIQLHTLREHGVVVTGPLPRDSIEPVAAVDLQRASIAIATMWQDAARHDPTWLPWLRGSREQAFVVLTLCRLLHTLDSGDVASKPAAARWAQGALGPRWAPLIRCALEGQFACAGQATDEEVAETLALVQYTIDRWRYLGVGPAS